ncbi:TPA: hypothetical protein IXN57_000426 [Enterococcus faecium]|uniref:NUMOD4 domain-containing protein n=1 Tax=Enterococcus faecium TaxID=1352 RepID=UPI00032E70F6|nr:NUMOD4 domain-containing protein [Enterococcus faecium]EOH45638.1 hypothetical protein SSI_01678 [Enterococcus faecium EnGen0191]HAQ3640936.1 hypothetical protein [Enterococcus faecium]HCU0013969.1 NUMOD4 motif-containing HNH endonuclease [Enterococcus faecium]
MTEVWKDIEGYEGLYQVSNLGRVKSLERVTIRKDGRKLPCRERILKLQTDRNSYCQIQLCKDGKIKNYRIHVLVAKHFIGERPESYQVNHIDENKANNAVFNLEYLTPKENSNHGTHNARVARNHEKIVLATSLKTKHAMVFRSTKEGGRHGFNQGDIAACCRGERKQHKGYTWQYI